MSEKKNDNSTPDAPIAGDEVTSPKRETDATGAPTATEWDAQFQKMQEEMLQRMRERQSSIEAWAPFWSVVGLPIRLTYLLLVLVRALFLKCMYPRSCAVTAQWKSVFHDVFFGR